jgi:hypothetical protein
VPERYSHQRGNLLEYLDFLIPDASGLDDLADRFARGAISAAEWTHATHLRVGAWHVHHLGPEVALVRLRAGIRSLNEAHGTVNSETRGYHETITAAYVRFIDQFLASCPREMEFETRVEELLSSTVASPDFLLCFYSREVLMSPRARREWVEPDLAPIPT